MIRFLLAATVAFVVCPVPVQAQASKPDKDGWYSLFDGKPLDGWKAADYAKAFKVEEGLIVAGATPLTHLYYVGPVQNAKFKDFELKTEVKTRPKGNSGFIFHTEFQDKGFPTRVSNSRSTTPAATRPFARAASLFPAFRRRILKERHP